MYFCLVFNLSHQSDLDDFSGDRELTWTINTYVDRIEKPKKIIISNSDFTCESHEVYAVAWFKSSFPSPNFWSFVLFQIIKFEAHFSISPRFEVTNSYFIFPKQQKMRIASKFSSLPNSRVLLYYIIGSVRNLPPWYNWIINLSTVND